ncbi:MAG: hypothetical protein Fur0010_09930 [Bdellovibrio sp.]
MKKCFVIFSMLFVFYGCASNHQSSLQRRAEDEYYLSRGPVRYFLSEIPYWANGSVSGQCFRKESSRFFDLKAVRQSYGLSYEEALQLQYAFNLELQQLKKLNTSGVLPLSQEEELFLQVSEKISSNIRSLQIPDYKKIHILWVDSIPLENRGKAVKKFINSEAGMSGFPMLLSFCYSSHELANWFSENVGNMSVRFAGHELLSPYDNRSELTPELATYWDSLFRDNQSVVFFKSKNGIIPAEVKTKKYIWKNID